MCRKEQYYGCASPILAEAKSALLAVKIAKDVGWKKVRLQMDALLWL